MGILKKLKRDLHVTDMWYDKMGASICLVNAQKGHPDKKNNKVKTSPLPCSVFLCVSRLVLKRKNVV